MTTATMPTTTDTAEYLFDVESVRSKEDLPELKAHGEYLLRVLGLRAGKSNKPGKNNGKKFYAITFAIEESTGDDAHPSGTRVKLARVQDEWDNYLRDLKGIIAAVVDTTPSAVTNKMLQTVIDSPDAVTDHYIRLRIFTDTNKKSGKSFRAMEFTPSTQQPRDELG